MKKQSHVYTVEVEKNGVLYSGTYTVEHGIVTVSYDGMQKTGHVGRMQPESTAKLLLFDLLRGQVKDEPHMEP